MQNVLVSRGLITLALVAGVLSGTPATAGRESFVVKSGGRPVAGAEVCFFPAIANDGFVRKFFSSNDERCLPADKLIRLPAGLWNFFAVSGDGKLVSVHPDFYTRSTSDLDESDAIGKTTVDVFPAGTLNFAPALSQLPPSESIAVYLPNLTHPESPASVRPLPRGQTRLTVPADVDLVPLIIRSGRPVRALETVRVAASGSVDVHMKPNAAKSADVFAVVRVKQPEGSKAPEYAPRARLVSADGSVHITAVPLRGGVTADRCLAIFRDVPLGKYRIELRGSHWLPNSVEGEALPGEPHALPQDLTAVPGAEVKIHWIIDDAARDALVVSRVPCNHLDHLERLTPPTVMLLKCAGASAPCSSIAEQPVTLDRGSTDEASFTVEGGTYVGQVVFNNIQASSRPSDVSVGDSSRLEVEVRPIVLRGSVRRGDDSLKSRLIFNTGDVISGTNGQYSVALSAPPAGTVRVEPCDNTPAYEHVLLHVYTEPTLDIVIPKNEINVTVSSAVDGSPLVDARVVLSPMRNGEEAMFDERMSDAKGMARFVPVSTGLPVEICAAHGSYKRDCKTIASIGDNETRALAFSLIPRDLVRGRLQPVPPALMVGRVFRVRLDGTLLDRSRIEQDGTFAFAQHPQPSDYFVVTGANAPLMLAHMDPDANGDIVLIPDGGSLHAFSVEMARADATATFTVAIGERLVPFEAFEAHQMSRNRDANVYGTNPTVVTDVMAADSVSVIRGPAPAVASPLNVPTIALTLPRYSASGRVIFPE